MLNCVEIEALVQFNSHFDISLEFLTAVTPSPAFLELNMVVCISGFFIIVSLQFRVMQELQSKPAVSASFSHLGSFESFECTNHSFTAVWRALSINCGSKQIACICPYILGTQRSTPGVFQYTNLFICTPTFPAPIHESSTQSVTRFDALQYQWANYYNTGDIDKNSIISGLIHIQVFIVNMLSN